MLLETILALPKVGRHKLWIQVSATQAEQLLAITRQRKISFKHVAELARAMEKGTYVDIPILVDRQGRVVNGQHRLWAIVKTGTRFVEIIVDDREILLGVKSRPEDSADKMSKLLGITIKKPAGALIKQAQLLDELKALDYTKLEERVDYLTELAAKAMRVKGGATALALAVLDEPDWRQFIEAVEVGEGGAPAVLIAYLASHAGKTRRDELTQELAAGCRAALRAWRSKKPIKMAAIERAAREARA
jgi:hypothetical protein